MVVRVGMGARAGETSTSDKSQEIFGGEFLIHGKGGEKQESVSRSAGRGKSEDEVRGNENGNVKQWLATRRYGHGR